MENVFLYCRTSTTEQVTSIKAQEGFNSDEYNILEVFSDFGKTATKVKNRPQFIEMLQKCGVKIEEIENKLIFLPNGQMPQVNLLLVSHTSRFMRNARLMEDVLDTLKDVGVEVRFLDMNKSSLDIDFKFTLSILFLLDEQESRNTSQKVKNGLAKARNQKKYLHAGCKLFGFDYDSENNRFVHNEDSKIVEDIFMEYSKGTSMKELAAKHNKNISRIIYILDNHRYSGMDRYGIYKKGTKQKSEFKEEELFKSDRIDAIISYELWKKCQEIKKSRRANNSETRKNGYSLSSKIICGNCGKKFFHKETNKRKPNADTWKCRTAHNEPHKCDMFSISEKVIIEWLKSRYGLKAIKFILEKRVQEAISNLYIEDEEALKVKIKPLEDRLKRKMVLYDLGDISEEQYLKERAEIKKKLDRYKDKIEELEAKEKTIKELKYLKMNYDKILDNYSKLLEDNPQELFKKIEYVKVIKVKDEKKKAGYKTVVDEIFFSDFEPVKRFYGVKRPIDFK